MPNNSSITTDLVPLYPILYEDSVRRALSEDFGGRGDVTTDAIVSLQDRATARIIARAPGRIAGIDVAGFAFGCLDPRLQYEVSVRDGERSYLSLENALMLSQPEPSRQPPDVLRVALTK